MRDRGQAVHVARCGIADAVELEGELSQFDHRRRSLFYAASLLRHKTSTCAGSGAGSGNGGAGTVHAAIARRLSPLWRPLWPVGGRAAAQRIVGRLQADAPMLL